MKALCMIGAILGTATILCGQGQITFTSNPTAPIRYPDGSFPEPGSIRVGLYYSRDFSATADTFTLEPSSTTPIGLQGVFLGGIKSIKGVPSETLILVEARAWHPDFSSYEEAIRSGATTYAARSGVLPNAVRLRYNIPPSFTTAGGYTGMTLFLVPEPSTVTVAVIGGLGILWGMGRGSAQKRARSARGPCFAQLAIE